MRVLVRTNSREACGMKATNKIIKACKLNEQAEKILHSFDDKIKRILNDDCAGLSFATDGVVVVYRGGNDNAFIGFMDFDEFLKSKNTEDALEMLDRAGI